jgi:hypothetical protein
LAEALSTTGMNEISKIFGKPGFNDGVGFDDSEMGCYLDVVLEDPFFGIVGWFLSECTISDECGYGCRIGCSAAIRDIP